MTALMEKNPYLSFLEKYGKTLQLGSGRILSINCTKVFRNTYDRFYGSFEALVACIKKERNHKHWSCGRCLEHYQVHPVASGTYVSRSISGICLFCRHVAWVATHSVCQSGMKVDCEGLGSGEVCFKPKLNSEPEFYIEIKSKVPSRPMWKAVAGHTHNPAIVWDCFYRRPT